MGKDKKKIKPSADVRFPRKSGTGTSRFSSLLIGVSQFPKKGGTGGKFTWSGDLTKNPEPEFMSNPGDVFFGWSFAMTHK